MSDPLHRLADTAAAPMPEAALPPTLAECHKVIQSQAALLQALQAQVSLLQERINLDSNNSSKPPSSNGPGQMNRAQRRASGRKRGAQPGHKGHSRAMVDESDLDRVVDCKPASVCECGAPIVPDTKSPRRHQVFEIAPMRAQVDEYRLYSGRCPGCGKFHEGGLPAGVPKGQLGPRALSLIGVLGTRYHLTQRKIRNLLDQMLSLSFSVGAISQAHGSVAQALKAPVAKAVASLKQAPALWMDETHYPRDGERNWVWAAVQPKLAVFCIYPSRARYVIQDLIGERTTAVVTSDRYGGYAYLDAERRQVCWAHLLRDFTRIGQRNGHAGRIGRKLHGLGLVMFRWRDAGKLEGGRLERLQGRIRATLERGASQRQCTRTANTCTNVLKLWPSLWTFTTNAALEPTNNAAEQALRSLVLKRKISGPTRSLRGDRFLGRGFTAHESCLRQGVDLWGFMHQAVVSWIAGTTPPSLIPQAVPSG